MRDAGYTEKTARNPKNLTGSKIYKEEMKKVTEELQKHLSLILSEMNSKIKTAEYHHLAEALMKVTNAIQLLRGRPTERIEYQLTEEERTKIEDIVTENIGAEEVKCGI